MKWSTTCFSTFQGFGPFRLLPHLPSPLPTLLAIWYIIDTWKHQQWPSKPLDYKQNGTWKVALILQNIGRDIALNLLMFWDKWLNFPKTSPISTYLIWDWTITLGRPLWIKSLFIESIASNLSTWNKFK